MNRYLHERSSGSVTVTSLDRSELLARLRVISGLIRAEHAEVKEVRLFGSVERGDQTGESDVDVLIVLRRQQSGDPLEQIRLFYPYFDLPIGVDLLVFSEDQIESRLAECDSFMVEVWQGSRPL